MPESVHPYHSLVSLTCVYVCVCMCDGVRWVQWPNYPSCMAVFNWSHLFLIWAIPGRWPVDQSWEVTWKRTQFVSAKKKQLVHFNVQSSAFAKPTKGTFIVLQTNKLPSILRIPFGKSYDLLLAVRDLLRLAHPPPPSEQKIYLYSRKHSHTKKNRAETAS